MLFDTSDSFLSIRFCSLSLRSARSLHSRSFLSIAIASFSSHCAVNILLSRILAEGDRWTSSLRRLSVLRRREMIRFSMLPEDIARGAEELGKIVENYDYGSAYPTPRVLLVCPPHLRQGIEHSVFTGFSSDAVETSHQHSLLYRKAAEKHNWLFFDAATVAKASERDKLHMECADHRKLAEALYSLITTNRFPPSFNPVRG